MAHHDAVGVRAAQHIFRQLEVIVDLRDRRPLLRRLGHRRRSSDDDIFGQILSGGGDDLLHHRRDDDHAGHDLVRPGQALQKIQHEFVRTVQHQNPGGDRPRANRSGTRAATG